MRADPRGADVLTGEALERDFHDVTKDHELTVLRDDGLYRHLRVAKPGTVNWAFDIVTWPGYLTICGDLGDYTFRRLDDMFRFFETANGINPDYWAQKLQVGAGGGADQVVRRFSNRKVRAVIHDWARDACDRFGVHGGEAWDETTAIYPHVLIDALDRELLYREFYDERDLFDALDELDGGRHQSMGLGFYEPWECDWRDFDTNFLLCCHAIVLAISMYRDQESDQDRTEVERLREVERAARVYVGEFDHLIGGEYPERMQLRQALGLAQQPEPGGAS